jgi:predicted DsbA family dithiol-disulfide isomerase
LISEGKKDGAHFQKWKIWPNTWKAHQLIQYCQERGISSSDRINQILFRAEYEQGLNLSLVDTLVQLACTEIGGGSSGNVDDTTINVEELREYLMRDQGKAVVQAEIRAMSSKYGIRGVPYFIVRSTKQDPSQRPYGFSGAQSSQTFLELFQELAEE